MKEENNLFIIYLFIYLFIFLYIFLLAESAKHQEEATTLWRVLHQSPASNHGEW